jgi:hypothetical protein
MSKCNCGYSIGHPLVPKCTCKDKKVEPVDNLKLILEECSHLIDSLFKCNNTGKYYRFFGVVIGSDDYYYGMANSETGKVLLLSCVGNLETHDFEVVEL